MLFSCIWSNISRILSSVSLFIFATSSSVNVQGSPGCFLFLVFLAGGFGCEEGALSFPLRLELEWG